MKQITKWVSFDDKEFATEAACKAHEAENAHLRLVGLTLEQVMAGIERKDADIARALETVGARIGRERRESGELMRNRRGTALGAADPSNENAPAPAGDSGETVAGDEPL